MFSDLEGHTLLWLMGVLSGVAMGVYAFQYWIWPRIQSLTTMGSKMPEERAADIMDRYRRELNEAEYAPRDFALAAPHISVVRTGRKDDAILCLLVNRGGTAANLHVESNDKLSVSVEPRALLKKDEPARIVLRGIDRSPTTLQFQLSYDDSYGQRTVRTFSWAEQAASFIEV